MIKLTDKPVIPKDAFEVVANEILKLAEWVRKGAYDEVTIDHVEHKECTFAGLEYRQPGGGETVTITLCKFSSRTKEIMEGRKLQLRKAGKEGLH